VPLAFHSLSHGTIPFGFFNVATDLVLLRDHFVFASDLCDWIGQWACAPGDIDETRPFWVIQQQDDIGNLHGAISGVDHSGLIGEFYRRYPFPALPREFAQDPEGHRMRAEAVNILVDVAGPARPTPISISSRSRTVGLGPYEFDGEGFAALVLYLWRGGMPRWRDDVRPEYVDRMMGAVRTAASPVFKGREWPGAIP